MLWRNRGVRGCKSCIGLSQFVDDGLGHVLVAIPFPRLAKFADGLFSLNAKGQTHLHLAFKAPLAIGEFFRILLVASERVKAELVGTRNQHHITV